MNTAVFEGIIFPNFVLGFKSGFQAPQRASNKTLIKGGQVFYFSYLFSVVLDILTELEES